MKIRDLKKWMVTLIAVVYSLAAFSYKTGDVESEITKEKFATDLIKNKKEYYQHMYKGHVDRAETDLQKVFDLRHQLDEQCQMDSLVLVEYNEYLEKCMTENDDFMEAERSCAITEEYAAYIIDLSFRLQEQLQEQLEQGNQDAAHRKSRELNHIGYEIDRLSKLYPEFDKNSSVALFNNMWRFF